MHMHMHMHMHMQVVGKGSFWVIFCGGNFVKDDEDPNPNLLKVDEFLALVCQGWRE